MVFVIGFNRMPGKQKLKRPTYVRSKTFRSQDFKIQQNKHLKKLHLTKLYI